MIKIKLDYYTLLSLNSFEVKGVGHIKSPKLQEISDITFSLYQKYVSILLSNVHTYYKIIDEMEDNYFSLYTEQQKELILKVRQEYNLLPDEEKNKINIFTIMTFDDLQIINLTEALNFFFDEDLVFNKSKKEIFLYPINSKTPCGVIHSQNYTEIVDIILQRICIEREDTEKENIKFKNKMAEKLFTKIKNSEKKKKNNDKRFELANMISSVSCHCSNLNIINIWQLTVYQLYDQFKRKRIDDQYNINSIQVSTWGNSDKFNPILWMSLLDE